MEKRLIDANKLMQDVEKLLYEGNPIVAFIRKQVDKQPTMNADHRWIPCEERLPEPNVAVLGYAPAFDNIYAVYYDSVCGWMTWSPVYDEPFPSFQGEIVAWMPLPEPYKGGEDERS